MPRTRERTPNVGGIMRRHFIALGPSETLAEAEQLMRMARVRVLPVTLGGMLLGVLSYRALVESLLGGVVEDGVARDSSLPEGLVASLIDGSAAPLTPGARLEEAAARLVARDEGFVAVVDELSERLVGVLTEMDLLRAAYEPRPREGRAAAGASP